MPEQNVASQSGIVRLDVADRAELCAAYMPFVTNGGLFVKQQYLTQTTYDMGADVFLLMHLVEQNERLPVAGKVVWVTPRNTGSQRPAGIGVQFAAQDGGATQQRLETLLAGMLENRRTSYTM
ncbi:type IV pilus assembly PilZ [Salinisphaera sp. C84B14]|jgi:type IV pilus assembly protein PilZ|uniref:PilZ domain-containing protein n=1 Tax=unclassified Salinisphaera TaxID=2649847 RepID=UPI000C4EC74B|nr:PilZ domain-containing protein [Salinisphaera sp.]MBS62697.1 pilus assembly protein PilZ [Salinisphaera sp.]